MRNQTIIAAVAAGLLTIVALLVWRHVTDLGERIAGLDRQVQDLGAEVVAAGERARAAEERAERAERDAVAEGERAQTAEEREMQTSEQARQAEQARLEAEERARLDAEARATAEVLARDSESARRLAEERRLAAEERSAEIAREAESARAEALRARAEAAELRRRMDRELDRMEGALGRIADTRRTALGLVMTLDGSQIEFDFNKAELRPRNRELLSRIAGVLLTFDDYSVQVFGHTDDVGSAEYNKQLSERRAEVVREYLIEAGVDPGVLSTLGMGKSSPRVEGTDPESRQRNRRVELAIVFSEGEYEALSEEREEVG